RRRRLEAQPRGSYSARRRDRQAALRRHGSGTAAARAADAGGARRVSESRDREMVADHQGGQHQGGMKRVASPPFQRGDAMKLPRRNVLHLTAGAAALPALSRVAWAQAYPTRPVRIIVVIIQNNSDLPQGRATWPWQALSVRPICAAPKATGATVLAHRLRLYLALHEGADTLDGRSCFRKDPRPDLPGVRHSRPYFELDLTSGGAHPLRHAY